MNSKSKIGDRKSSNKKGKYTSYAVQKEELKSQTNGNLFSKNGGTSFGGSSCNDRSIEESDSEGSQNSK